MCTGKGLLRQVPNPRDGAPAAPSLGCSVLVYCSRDPLMGSPQDSTRGSGGRKPLTALTIAFSSLQCSFLMSSLLPPEVTSSKKPHPFLAPAASSRYDSMWPQH